MSLAAELSREEQRKLAGELVAEIGRLADKAGRHLRFMEVCGTHTVSIFRAGIRQLLPESVELVSGPGCPVCVTPDEYMDKAIAYACREDCIITTFGDMLKVPGTESSLGEAKTAGADIRIVYSPLDSLQVARENPDKKVIFLAVGFETTAPTAAATVLAAKQAGLTNLYMLSAQKLVPPALRLLIDDPEVLVDGFILPGHVSVVTGTEVFKFLESEYHIPGVVTGFEPLQILRSLYRLTRQVAEGVAKVENEYGSVVKPEGNPTSMAVTNKVYEPVAAKWRGIGEIPASGLKMRDAYKSFDIEEVLPLPVAELPQPRKTGCRCGEVLKGIVTPHECPLFGKACVPTHAIGPCMVSVEGVCAAWYKYGKGLFTYGNK
ncbi:hydrogenase formation protein HypD [Selenomonas sp. AB3002]|uniref:hydrogenase formation protein HypD n=1 Tax=Selenomonas sp. AB3002 TaxID=1392502 RepID=UPI000497D154